MKIFLYWKARTKELSLSRFLKIIGHGCQNHQNSTLKRPYLPKPYHDHVSNSYISTRSCSLFLVFYSLLWKTFLRNTLYDWNHSQVPIFVLHLWGPPVFSFLQFGCDLAGKIINRASKVKTVIFRASANAATDYLKSDAQVLVDVSSSPTMIV